MESRRRRRYNGTTVADGRITSSQDVTVTRYNAMDVQRQMKVDFCQRRHADGGSIETDQTAEQKRHADCAGKTASSRCIRWTKQNNKRYYAGRESGTPFGDWTGTRENAVRFKSGADGMVQLNEFMPRRRDDGTLYTYYVEEIPRQLQLSAGV